MGEQQKIVIASGSVGDPERERCFRNVQVALAGSSMGAAMAALVDSLAVSICVAATDRTNATIIMAAFGNDLMAAMDRNWDQVRAQLAATSAPVSSRAQ